MQPIFTTIARNIRASLLLKNTIILFIGTTIANILNYIFNLIIGRIMTLEEYGELVALETILLIIGVLGGTLTTMITRQVATYKARGDWSGLRIFKKYFEKLFFVFGIAIFIVLLVFNKFIAEYLKTSLSPMLLIDVSFIFTFVALHYQSILQGLQKFVALSAVTVLAALIKVLVGVGLVFGGFSVIGAVTGYVSPIIFVALTAFFLLKFIDRAKIDMRRAPIKLESRHFTHLAKFFFATLCLTLLYNTDLLMVKHYFSAHDGGLYSSLAMLARIIFFGTGIIAMVLLPMATEKYERKEKHLHLFLFSFSLVFVVAAVLSALYFIFPKFVILALFGEKYLAGTNLLGIMGLMMSVYSLLNVVIFYLISMKKFGFLWPISIGTLLQIVLIWQLHTSLFQVIMISLSIIGGVLAASIFWLFLGKKAKNSNL